MTILPEDRSKYERLAEFFKKFWNIRADPNEFNTIFKKEFPKKDIEMFVIYFIEKIGQNPNESTFSVNEYMYSLISEDLSIFLADIDLENPNLVIGARKIVEMSKVDSFTSLPIYSERSAKSALNALLVVLLNDNKSEMKKDVMKFSFSTYFSILISSGRLFCPEKFQMVQQMFKEKDPFDCPIHQLPITQIHLVMSLFPCYSMEQLTDKDNYKNLCLLFAVFELINCSNYNVKIINNNNDNRASFHGSFINYYLAKPSYVLSMILASLSKTQFKSGNVIKIHDLFSFNNVDFNPNSYPSFHFYSNFSNNQKFEIFPNFNDDIIFKNKSDHSEEEEENVLHFIYNSRQNSQRPSAVFNFNIVHDQLPNGLFPTYESLEEFLTATPESISIDSLIEDALHYPAFVSEVANIFMQKLKEKDYESVVVLSNQILKRIDDIRLTWIFQLVFFPIMNEMYECLKEIDNDSQFEVIFYLFYSFYDGCTKIGDDKVIKELYKFISKIDEPFRSFLENSLSENDELIVYQNDYLDNEKPINRLINSLKRYKETNDIDIDELIKYPYLLLSAFLWGVKTVHQNSLKLLSIKFPNYKILKRLFVYLSSCHQEQTKKSQSSIFFSIPIKEYSTELLMRFPPSYGTELHLILQQNIACLASYSFSIKKVQGVIISWRAWIKTFSIKKFVITLIEALILNEEGKLDHMKTRNGFIFAVTLLTTAFINPIKSNICSSISNHQMQFDSETNKFVKVQNKSLGNDFIDFNADDDFKIALWTAIEFVNDYDGTFTDGMGIASFCLLLIIVLKNDWKSEYKKVLSFILKSMEDSNWKSLKYSFATNFLYISLSILEVQELLKIDMFDSDFLQVNWRFAINYFYLHSEVKRLQESNVISLD